MKSENTIQRIKEYIDYKGISVRRFEESVGFSNGSFGSQYKNNKTIGVDKVEYILQVYDDINPIWLLTGRGSMLLNSTNPEEIKWSSTPIATPISPAEESVIYKMYEKKDEESRALIRENGRLEERLRSMEQELGALKSKYPHESPPGIVRESGEVLGLSETAKDAHSKRRTPASEPSYKHL